MQSRSILNNPRLNDEYRPTIERNERVQRLINREIDPDTGTQVNLMMRSSINPPGSTMTDGMTPRQRAMMNRFGNLSDNFVVTPPTLINIDGLQRPLS